MSDLNADFGHAVVDVTSMEFDSEFDAILCANVLEHVYDSHVAIARLQRALKPGGQLFVSVPVDDARRFSPEVSAGSSGRRYTALCRTVVKSCSGVFQPRVLRGHWLSSAATSRSRSGAGLRRSVPLGK